MHTPELQPVIGEAIIYPVKGCRPIIYTPGRHVNVGDEGLEFDRRFMVIGEEDRGFRTQRKQHKGAKLALIDTAIDEQHGELKLSADGMGEIVAPLSPTTGEECDATIWGDSCRVIILPEATEPLSNFLGQRVQLARKCGQRFVNRPTVPSVTRVGFQDRYPILAISRKTLERFNDLLQAEWGYRVPMARFRPNLILEEIGDRQENNIIQASVRNVLLRRAKQCERCEVPGIDQVTAEARKGVLETLRDYYKPFQNRPPIFGEQFYVQRGGMLRVGDALTVPERDTGGWSRRIPEAA